MNETIKKLIIKRERFKEYLSDEYIISERDRKYYEGIVNGLSIAIGILYDEEEKAVVADIHKGSK